jgi:hypothetical protein
MASPDNSTVWAQRLVTAGRASEARGAGDGAALAILSEGEEAYDNLYDSRDDSKFRAPLEFKSYYLSKRLPDETTSSPKFLPGTRLYHEHIGTGCPLGLKDAQPGAARVGMEVALPVAVKALKKRKRGSRGRRK